MKSKKHTIYTILIIIGSLASIGVYVYIFSLIEDNNVSVKSIEVQIKNIEEQKLKIKDVKKEIEDTENMRSDLGQHFLTKSDIVRFFDTLETESKLAKVDFSIVSADEIKVGEPFKFELKTIGDYRNNYHFLKILESLPYDVRIVYFGMDYLTNIPGKLIAGVAQPDRNGWIMNVSLELLLNDK